MKYGGKHKIFPFEQWEIEYPTNTESKRIADIGAESPTDANAPFDGISYVSKYRCAFVSLYRYENRGSVRIEMGGYRFQTKDYHRKIVLLEECIIVS